MSSSDQQSAHKLSESPAAVEVQKSASVNVCLGVRLNTQKGREFKGRCVCVPACVCACVCVCVCACVFVTTVEPERLTLFQRNFLQFRDRLSLHSTPELKE